MQLVYFRAARSDHRHDAAHAEMVRGMRALAESIDGFVEWRDCSDADGLDYWGIVIFDSEESALAWKGHPTHNAIHQRGEDEVYTSFGTLVFDLVRQASWSRDDVGA